MNTNPDPEREDTLLDAVLRDESWQTVSAAFKAEALGKFGARQRRRRLTRWMGCMAALAVAGVCAVYWFGRPPAAPPQIAVKQTAEPRKMGSLRYLTDEELLASFPKGSCMLAEINGRKELVFLDPDLERIYLSKPVRTRQ